MVTYSLGQNLAVLSLAGTMALSASHYAMAQVTEDEVIVTGQKIERSLQDTQASVEVITAIDIQQENIY